ncbi:MAG: helix-turn-helix domain-containing protein [Bacteroidota bacterium]|jgi:transcriptional regulator with XRE-family HTH domain|nr:helix-turn-helix domain-containing protein [Bacteroidota bacterium]
MNVNLISIGERLRKYLKYKGIGVNEYGNFTNTSGAQISNILNGKNFGITKLINIIKYSEDLNLDWLLKGKGEMLIDGTREKKRKPINEAALSEINTLQEENDKLIQEINLSNSKLNQYESAMEYKNLTIDAYKTTIEVLSSSNKELKELLTYFRTSPGETNNKRTA